ncbi:molybdopterin biosynthesis protein [Kroppenstedtia guangzhouensis]|uniref:Molybdopterin molybdenumtransferase n=1 Tax=Kroppenstedtia guangzhouensis TaxID=1274356 RepID=A0ABQ1GRY6_9BACL|nr:molybdopterin-binding protein [Kroppenstedtia guangzhouensis]GGA48894.1 molybdopterin biosynthesis protein [Kroppenstedtia guangzhouensis]
MRKSRLDTLSRKEALSRLLAAITFHPRKETVPVTDARGRVTAEPVIARMSMPPYPAAAMDGIALRTKVTWGASPLRPVRLREGRDFTYINTGDPLPENADSVVRIEKVNILEGGGVELTEPALPWKHVRQPGEDVAAGEVVLPAGHRIRPVDQGALLAAGVERLTVVCPPRVGILPTGSELVPPGHPLKPGQLREFNSTVLAGFLEECGAVPDCQEVVPDRKEALRAAFLSAADRCDIVVVNAGSSAGSKDFTPRVLAEVGKVLLHGVAARPGRPVVLAIIGETPVVGLPGYPVSAYLAFDWFVRPLIRHWYRSGAEVVPPLLARLGREVRGGLGTEDFIRMRVAHVDGQYTAFPLARGGGITMSMVRADAWLRLPPDTARVNAGEQMELEWVRTPTEVEHTLVLTGCDDPLLDRIGALIGRISPGWSLFREYTGHEVGFELLRKGGCHAVAIHGDRWEGGFSGIIRIRVAEREMGWITSATAPEPVSGVADLIRLGLRLINRPPGSATRKRLTQLLNEQKAGRLPSGWERTEGSHWKAAASLAGGTADVTVGPRSVAKAFNLVWRPAWREPLDLVLPRSVAESDAGRALIGTLRCRDFREMAAQLGGYDHSRAGEIIDPPVTKNSKGGRWEL